MKFILPNLKNVYRLTDSIDITLTPFFHSYQSGKITGYGRLYLGNVLSYRGYVGTIPQEIATIVQNSHLVSNEFFQKYLDQEKLVRHNDQTSLESYKKFLMDNLHEFKQSVTYTLPKETLFKISKVKLHRVQTTNSYVTLHLQIPGEKKVVFEVSVEDFEKLELEITDSEAMAPKKRTKKSKVAI